MVIKVDMQGRETLNQLCDIALRQGGLSNLDGIVGILQSVELIDPNVQAVEVDTEK